MFKYLPRENNYPGDTDWGKGVKRRHADIY